MQTILVIARREWQAAFRNRQFLIITALFLGLSILSVYIGSTTKHAEMRLYNDTVARLTAEGSTVLPAKPEINTLAILANLTEYVSIVGAILAVILGYNALIEEKQSGGLKLILTRPVYRDRLLTDKLLGNAAVIGALLGLAFVFNVTLLVAIRGVWPTLGEISRLAAFIGLSFVYMLIFLTVSMLLSIRMKSSANVFLVVLVLWMLVSFVLPQMAETQMTNSTVVNSISGTTNQIPQDTTTSRALNFLSPTWHLRDIGATLLEVTPGSTTLSAGSLISHSLTALLALLAPCVVFVAAGYALFLRNETLTLE